MRNGRLRNAVWVVLGLLWSMALPVWADGADVARGVTWLQGQVRPDGRLSTPSRLALPYQAQCETAQTLLRLAGNSAQVSALVAAIPSSGADTATETLACGQFMRQQQGQSAGAGLASRRVDMSGYAAFDGMRVASPLDTAWAMAAVSSTASAADKQGVHAWLLSVQQADGSFKAHAHSNVYTTGIVLRGLKDEAARSSQALQAARAAAAYLLSKKSAAGHWGNDDALTSLVFEAVHPYSGQDATLAPAVETYLLAKQRPDGSWAGDPYTTALALRALALTAIAPQNPGQSVTTGTLRGTAKDPSGQPLADVAVAAMPSTGGTAKVAVTNAQGVYAITDLPAGPVSLSAAKNGYSQVGTRGTIEAGGVLVFSPVLTPAVAVTLPASQPPAGSSTVSVGGTVKDGAGHALEGVAVTVTPSGGAPLVATTTAQGSYSIANIPAGTLMLSAAKTGYVTASASVTLPAGSTGVFSPTLQSSNDPGTRQVTISGQVVAADTRAGLAGVGVTVETSGGPTVNTATDANGRFSTTATAGALKLTYARNGYGTVSQQATASGGTALDAGVVPLPVARQTSSLRGIVTDTQGVAVAGAVVDVAAKTATTNGAGAYLVTDLPGTAFTVKLGAAGFQSRTYQLTVAAPGDIAQDFVLPRTSGDVYLELKDLKASPPSAGLNQDVTVSVTASNPSTASASSAVMLEVQGHDGKVVTQLSGLDVGGLPIGVLTLAPGAQSAVKFLWNAASVPAGNYALLAKLYLPGSRSTRNPSGTVTGNLRGSLAVAASPHFAGSAAADPPVVQAGANMPVKLSALLRNDGNVALPGATYLLSVTDAKGGAKVYQTSATGPAIPLSAIATVDFGQWTPSVSGSYRLEVTSAAAPGSTIVAPLYVGDMAKASFTVDKTVVPPGTQQVTGNIHVTGIDMASGTSVDPLAGVIREAVGKAVNYGDNFAFNHYVGDLRCFACHVQTQAVVGGERNLRFAKPLDPNKRVTLLNGIVQNVAGDGSVSGAGYPRSQTSLSMWATTAWHDQSAVHNANRQLATFLTSTQQPDGSWYQDHNSSWYDSSASAAGLNLSSLVEYSQQLKLQAGAGTQPVVSPLAIRNLAGGDMRLSTGSDGTLYIAHMGAGAVYRVLPGTDVAQLVVSGIPVTGARPVDGDRLLVSARNGIYLGDLGKPNLQVSDFKQLSTMDTFDVQAYAKGGYLVSPYGGRSLYRLSETGALTRLVDSDLLQSSSGTTQVQSDGSILVHANAAQRMLRFTPDGSYQDTPLPLTNGGPLDSTPYRDGYLLGTDSGLYYYNKDWVAERLLFQRTYGQALLPDGRIVVNTNGALYAITMEAVSAQTVGGQVDTSIGKAADWLAAGSGIDPNHNVQQAFRLMGLAKAKSHYQGTSRYKAFDRLMAQIGQTLWSRQRADGGWERTVSYGQSDPVVTAIVGVALDTLQPSKDDPRLRQAIQYVLNTQNGDGSWSSTNGLGGKLLSSTWIEIWLPAMLDRLGAIDADLQVTFPPGVAVGNPEPPASRTATQPDGSVEYVWNLTGVTGSGRDVDLDLTLKDMGEQEVRHVAAQASLVFRNSFTSGEVVSPVVVPRVASNARIDLQVSTDQPSYWSTDTARFTALVRNGGVAMRDVQVRFSVLDAGGKTVAVLPLPAIVSVDKAAANNTAASWNVAGVLAGPYQVLAELVATDGTVYGSAKAPFAVKGSQGPANATRISTDKAQYTAAQPVQLQSVASNVSVNFLQEALTVETVVTDAQGREVLRKTEPIVQLPPTARRQYVYALATANLPPGIYQARLRLMGDPAYKNSRGTAARDLRTMNGASVLLSESTTSFQIVAAAVCAPGAFGTLRAQPSPAAPGQAVALALQLDNPAARPIQNATVRMRIVDAASGNLVEEQSVAGVDIPPSGQWKTARSWQATGALGQSYLAIASLETAGCADVVAHASLALAQVAAPGNGGQRIETVPLHLHTPLLVLLPLLAWGALRRRRTHPAAATNGRNSSHPEQ